MRRWLKAVALIVVTVVVVPVTTAGTVLGAFLFLPLPAVVPEPRLNVTNQISHVYDINGDEVGAFQRFETTKPLSGLQDIPRLLQQAVIAAEDRRFYEHGGVDPRGTLRALWADLRNAGSVQGGSTITQQYVKNRYTGRARSLSRKLREAILASQLDRQKSKDEILFLYLDQLYLGEGAFGVGAAAETYFQKTDLHQLTLSEMATLAGLIPAPSRFDPRLNPAAADGKRRLVLKLMLEQGYISQAQYDDALPQQVWYSPSAPPAGTTVTLIHPREQQRTRYPYFFDYVRRYLEDRYGRDAVYTRGLKIYTTLDPKLQQAAEEEVARTLDGAPQVEMALASVEPGSGYIKALVGGRDFYAPGGQVNLALGGSTGRQTGSAFKPFVLAEALTQGVSPNKVYNGGSPKRVGDKDFKNYENSRYGNLTLREATKRSVNTVYVQLLEDVGIEKTMDLARSLGVSRSVYKAGFHGLSVALGVVESSPLEMASAYGVWAARGYRAEPTPVVKVLDGADHVLEDNSAPKPPRVMKEETADLMNDVLQGPLQAGGTAGGKGFPDRPAAGKTGTTQDNGNAWFVGYTPQLSTAVWMGHRADQHPMGAVKGVRSVTGGTWPARTWQAFMKRALDGAPVIKFSEPAPITRVATDAKRAAHKGFEVGTRRPPGPSDDGGSYDHELPPPEAVPPKESTTTTTTTTLVRPGVGF